MKLKECFDNIISGEWGEECLVGEKGTKILRTTNFTNIGKIDYRDVVERKISDAKIDKKRLKYGDIILEKSGGTDKTPVGRVVFCDHNIETDIYLCNNFTVGLRTNTTCIAKYLFYLLFFNHQQGKTLALQNKTTGIRNLKVDSYLNCKISLPSIDDQKRIADELDKVSELIEKRQQQLDQSDLLIKSRFVEMFGDYDLRRISVEMEELSTLGTVIGGSTPDTNEASFWGGENLWITPAELSNEDFVINDTVRKLTDAGVDSCSLRLLPKDTVLLSSRAPIGKVAIAGKDMYCNQGFKNIICGPRLHCVYMYCLLKYNTEYLNSLGRGATFKEISKSIVEKIKLRVPPIELQNQFADFVEKVEQNKAKIKTSLSELNTLKKALMQKYFG